MKPGHLSELRILGSILFLLGLGLPLLILAVSHLLVLRADALY